MKLLATEAPRGSASRKEQRRRTQLEYRAAAIVRRLHGYRLYPLDARGEVPIDLCALNSLAIPA